jgi:tetratricopeptide (TPR) repeat protein
MPSSNTQLDRIAKLHEGDLGETPFAVLLWALARARRTTAIDIRRGPLHKEIFLEDGVPVDCRSNLVHETLSRFMVSTGRLDEATATDAFRESMARSVRFGDVLIERELVTAEDLMKILQQNLAHKLLDGFSWRDGSFRLTASDPDLDSPLKVNVVQLVLIGVSRFATQEQIDGSIAPLIGTRLAVNPSPAVPIDDIKLPAGHKPLVEALQAGPMRIDELATTTGIPYPELTRSLYALNLIEMVLPADQVPKLTLEERAGPPRRPTEAPTRPVSRQPAREVPEEVRNELMELALNHRRKDPFELLGVDPDRVATTAHLCFLKFAEKFAPWRFEDDLADKARDVFLAGARAYAHLCEPDRRSALVEQRKKAVPAAPMAKITNQFRVETDLLDADKQFQEGLQLAKNGDLTKALNQLEFAADLNPQNAVYRSELAFCRFRLDPEANALRAAEELREAIRLDPHCGLALYYTGEILRQVGRFDEAEVFLKRALKPMAPDRRPVDALRSLSQERKVST